MDTQSEWTYRAELVEVVDGDTVDLRVDLGFKTYKKIRIRLDGVDTAEIFGPDSDEEYERGIEQKEFVVDFLDVDGDWPLMFESVEESGKYGRWIGDIAVDGERLTDALRDEWPNVDRY